MAKYGPSSRAGRHRFGPRGGPRDAVGLVGVEQPARTLPKLGLAGAGSRERHLDDGVLVAAGVDVFPVAHVDADVGDALAIAEGEEVAGEEPAGVARDRDAEPRLV